MNRLLVGQHCSQVQQLSQPRPSRLEATFERNLN